MPLVRGEMALLWAFVHSDTKKGSVLPRPCVVTSTSFQGFTFEVVYGEGSPFGEHYYEVSKDSDLGQRLGLSKTTYFTAIENLYSDSIERFCVGECPAHDFIELQAVAERLR